VEKYPRVTELFYERNPAPPAELTIVHADIFEYVNYLPPTSLDGIFFDSALPEPFWDDEALWDKFMPLLIRALRPGEPSFRSFQQYRSCASNSCVFSTA
jgi:hypothetical protein